MALINKLSAIGNAIREKTGKTDLLTLEQMPQEIKSIETAGGGDSWYDAFWDEYQLNGARVKYDYGFTGSGWNTNIFKPKYDIKPTDASYMFYGASGLRIDLAEYLEALDIDLDFSNCINFSWLIYGSSIKRLGVIDMRKVNTNNNANSVFRQGGADNLETIDKVIVSEKYPLGNNSFTNCTKLKDITIEGNITGNFAIGSSSKLTDDSVNSIINALADLTGTTAKTITFNTTVKNNLTEEQIATITSKNWTLA